MAEPDEYTFQRYLEAKRTVDDRALHRPTVDRLRAELASRGDGRPIRVLDVGAGTGAMLRRLLDWDVLQGAVDYTGVDAREQAVTTGRHRIEEWAAEHDWGLAHEGTRADPFEIDRDGHVVRATLQEGDVFEVIATGEWEPDLIVGCAFLDVVELGEALPRLFGVGADTLVYFPITFDGETIFRPVHDRAIESRMMDAFHATMNEPDRPGGSRTGRQLFDAIPSHGGRLLSAGGSDWVISPDEQEYPADEAYFLHHIIDIVTGAVEEYQPADLDPAQIRQWGQQRHTDVTNAELVYSTHQFDVLAKA